MFKIKTLNNISQNGLKRLPTERYQIVDALDGADAVLVRSADMHAIDIPASVLAIARAGAGTNNIPIAAMSKRGVPVFNAPGANANAVKELVLAGMLLSARNIADALAFSASLPAEGGEELMEKEKKRFVGSELIGRTLGVIGLGAIGVRVANAARALGMRVIGFDPHMTVEGAWALSSDVIKAGSMNEVYAASDFISFHVPLNDATRGSFSLASLDAVKPGVVLLNFSRDGILAHDAIKAGLADGRIGRYVTDFPKPDYQGNPRVIGLPHLGASTEEAEENCALMVVDQLREFLEHGNVVNSVNFPTTRMHRTGKARICVANANKPNMIGQLSATLGAAGINIAQMHNASRGDHAYNLVDVDNDVGPEVVEHLRAIDGVLSVRVIA
ncbi:MAG: phosphoglycerate dehydrogenase [Rhodanobacteraceae bacterium]|jgi:D-3-phosphoglycerate dehydrogenase|nr:phosphoglycerate dehydrogenase [Rhodanobacteraceae bacterium]MBL0041606.1 phosphoglycerate dehydrogenase [Xanthomonadales bacterium]MBP6078068.1 phosphoglycerate dehydrogenase [Xanthomonadales bacterium]MBP7622552.1 phosphoglycerate dehydrogenase [Xanthomonadales bacterium]